MLSGTAIAGRPLGRARLATVEPVLVGRLGKARLGEPQLCEVDGTTAPLAVVQHRWPGFTVSYGSSGGTAVAIAWTVSLDKVPDGFTLADGATWRPGFAELRRRPGAEATTVDGRLSVRLPVQRLAFSGPAGASRPDTAAGGVQLRCP